MLDQHDFLSFLRLIKKNKKTTTLPDPTASPDLNNLPTGQYEHTGDVDINSATIAEGKQITLFINGDVTIHGPLTYDTTWDPNLPSDIPYLVIIARDITTDNAVTQLDGLYVAQPQTTTDGQFNSCDPALFCSNQLVVNGAIIAQQVNFLRVHGSVGVNINQDDDGICSPYPIVQCPPAEVVHYLPSMIIGNANLLLQNSGAVVQTGVEGIFSLPPVF